MREKLYTFAVGGLGMTATGGSLYVSIMEKIEITLRVGVALCGLVIGILTIQHLVKRKNKRKVDNEQ